METTAIPAQLPGSDATGEVAFVPYISSVPVLKGRVSLGRHMISLIIEGEKRMHVANETLHLTPDRILLMASGNILFTERPGINDRIRSTMIFFDDQAIHQALQQPGKPGRGKEQRPYLLFDRDEYLRGFVAGVNLLLEQHLMSPALQQAKLSELLLYLHSRHPGRLDTLRTAATHPDEERLRQVVEAHISEQLTLPELAFLCHMSLPTFKRKFEQVYRQSPARWLQIQRLTLAANRLRSKTAKPGDVYLEAGYENHSSFSKAFRQYFGVLPKDYAI